MYRSEFRYKAINPALVLLYLNRGQYPGQRQTGDPDSGH